MSEDSDDSAQRTGGNANASSHCELDWRLCAYANRRRRNQREGGGPLAGSGAAVMAAIRASSSGVKTKGVGNIAGALRLVSGPGNAEGMQAGQSSHVYTISAPRDFFAAWLAPRLAEFRKANPEVRYSLINDETADFTEANLDLAVRWAEGPGDLEGVALGSAERVTAGEGDWIAWPGDPDPEGEGAGPPTLQAGDAGQALAAAAAGMGKARVPAQLAQTWAGAGRGVTLSDPEPCRRAYWLVAPLPQWRQKKVRALVEALSR